MVTKKTIKVPIYNYKVVIIVADTWKEAHELYPSIGERTTACVFENSDNSIIVVPPQPDLIVHECVHLKNCIWNYIGYKPVADNDEVDAYLVDYLFTQVSKVAAKHDLATHY
nr:MAG TPA: hypothetical protein [Crassvirales sp.]